MRILLDHFQNYRRRTPWAFCWRITLESLAVGVAIAFILDYLGAEHRALPSVNIPALFVQAVMVGPVLETLLFQVLLIGVARWCGLSFGWQVTWSTIVFSAVHFLDGLGAGICAGLVGGFYLAFTCAHWWNHSGWTAFWTTALSHSLRNGLILLGGLLATLKNG